MQAGPRSLKPTHHQRAGSWHRQRHADFLKGLSFIGMIATLWVGGKILAHGLHELGVHGLKDWVKHAAAGVAGAAPVFSGILAWLVMAGIAAVFGLIVGASV